MCVVQIIILGDKHLFNYYIAPVRMSSHDCAKDSGDTPNFSATSNINSLNDIVAVAPSDDQSQKHAINASSIAACSNAWACPAAIIGCCGRG